MHSVTSSPATSMWMPARRCPDAQPVSARRMNVEGLVDLSQDLLEVAGLDAIRRGARIAVHGIAAPEHRLARGARGLNQRRQKTGGRVRAAAMNQSEAPRFVVRVQDFNDFFQRAGLHPRPDLDADRIADAAEELTCAPRGPAVRIPIQGKCVERSYQPSCLGTQRSEERRVGTECRSGPGDALGPP